MALDGMADDDEFVIRWTMSSCDTVDVVVVVAGIISMQGPAEVDCCVIIYLHFPLV